MKSTGDGFFAAVAFGRPIFQFIVPILLMLNGCVQAVIQPENKANIHTIGVISLVGNTYWWGGRSHGPDVMNISLSDGLWKSAVVTSAQMAIKQNNPNLSIVEVAYDEPALLEKKKKRGFPFLPNPRETVHDDLVAIGRSHGVDLLLVVDDKVHQVYRVPGVGIFLEAYDQNYHPSILLGMYAIQTSTGKIVASRLVYHWGNGLFKATGKEFSTKLEKLVTEERDVIAREHLIEKVKEVIANNIAAFGI